MELVGRWKIVEMLRGTEDGPAYVPVETVLAENQGDRSITMTVSGIMEFCDNNDANLLFPIPENVPQEEIQKAEAAGQVKLSSDRKFMIREQKKWKDNGDGTFSFNMTGDDWTVIKELADGRIEMLTNHYEKI